MNDMTQSIDLSLLFGFDAIADAGELDFSDNATAARLGAKVGGIGEPLASITEPVSPAITEPVGPVV